VARGEGVGVRQIDEGQEPAVGTTRSRASDQPLENLDRQVRRAVREQGCYTDPSLVAAEGN
jgi:hypothetical protein